MDDDGHVCLTDFGLSKIVGKDESVLYYLILFYMHLIKIEKQILKNINNK
jgi:hypothetical protein